MNEEGSALKQVLYFCIYIVHILQRPNLWRGISIIQTHQPSYPIHPIKQVNESIQFIQPYLNGSITFTSYI
jgi:hypothetical protein